MYIYVHQRRTKEERRRLEGKIGIDFELGRNQICEKATEL